MDCVQGQIQEFSRECPGLKSSERRKLSNLHYKPDSLTPDSSKREGVQFTLQKFSSRFEPPGPSPWICTWAVAKGHRDGKGMHIPFLHGEQS